MHNEGERSSDQVLENEGERSSRPGPGSSCSVLLARRCSCPTYSGERTERVGTVPSYLLTPVPARGSGPRVQDISSLPLRSSPWGNLTTQQRRWEFTAFPEWNSLENELNVVCGASSGNQLVPSPCSKTPSKHHLHPRAEDLRNLPHTSRSISPSSLPQPSHLPLISHHPAQLSPRAAPKAFGITS